MDRPASSGGHFDRFRALMDTGWAATLSKNELTMWMAYERFSDRDGIAFPDGRRLARMIGHATDNHVSDLRRALVAKGLLEVVEVGGGRGKPTKVRVLTPAEKPDLETLPLFGSVSEDENPPEKPSRIEDKPSHHREGFEKRNPPEFGDKPSRNAGGFVPPTPPPMVS